MRAPVVLFLIAVGACASAGNDPGVGYRTESSAVVVGSDLRMTDKSAPHVTTVNFSVGPVFKALQSVYDSLGIPLTMLDFKQHIIGNQGMRIRAKLGKVALSKYIDCGNSQNVPSADTYDVFLSVVTVVKANEPVGSDIVTTLQAGAKPLTYAQEFFSCSTTGVLEKNIAQLANASFFNK